MTQYLLYPPVIYNFLKARVFYLKNSNFRLTVGHGKCGVAIIRVSGPQSLSALRLLTNTSIANNSPKPIRPRYASLRSIYYPNSDEIIDNGLVLWFPGPNSFTGEDCCEFQVHGGVAVVTAICNALNSVAGVRPALAGEFTRRAFRSNKLDLSEAEGIADLIHAETEIQRKQALLQANGVFSAVYNEWCQQLYRAVGSLEAYIDFAEDENIEPETMDNVQNEVAELTKKMNRFLRDSRKGEMRKNGVRSVILGEPNVGKSSFMNFICEKPISIISNIEGTTRDVIECSFNIGGFPVIIADTAGLRHHTSDPIEKEGITRAKNYASEADLIILIVEAKALTEYKRNSKQFVGDILRKLGVANDKEMIVIANKSDQIDNTSNDIENDADVIYVSCTEKTGIDQALSKIEHSLKKLTDCDTMAISLSAPNDRHRQFLSKSLECLQDFQMYTKENDFDYSLAALHLREAMHQLQSIAGRTMDNEKMYDFIFKQFCIGK